MTDAPLRLHPRGRLGALHPKHRADRRPEPEFTPADLEAIWRQDLEERLAERAPTGEVPDLDPLGATSHLAHDGGPVLPDPPLSRLGRLLVGPGGPPATPPRIPIPRETDVWPPRTTP